eukprot:comp20623_c0_seq1/m.42045 comp20623_c0_seq1/g.42045  ORF comp20623_c0_seq1/g.42045 comp20623_c0_seq1/m.42045 type:complete len:406 (-) comp20623_c0_seq1:140-1357(-)
MKLPSLPVLAVLAVLGIDMLVYFRGYMCTMIHPRPHYRIALLADPQIEGDARVHREGFLGTANNWLNDVFHHLVAVAAAQSSPDAAVVLGDIFSYQGLDDTEFDERADRFDRSILQPFADRNIPVHVIPGNHDLGYAWELNLPRVRRWEARFGPVNKLVPVSTDTIAKTQNPDMLSYGTGHSLAFLNGLSLDSESHFDMPHQEIRKKTLAFFEELKRLHEAHLDSQNISRHGIILFTHIPLHKENNPHCLGDRPHIERDTRDFVVQQNMISEQTTEDIVEEIAPDLVFTGHDHEGCIFQHNIDTKEHTVRSMMGDYAGNFDTLDIFVLNRKTDYADGSQYGTPLSSTGMAHRSRDSLYQVYSCPLMTMKRFVVLLAANLIVAAAFAALQLRAIFLRITAKNTKSK